jgi:hypothetical protein
MKKRFILSLLSLGILGFLLIVLQYKVTEVSLQIPVFEEKYLELKQQKENLELSLRTLKNPKRLFEEKDLKNMSSLNFPKASQVICVNLSKSQVLKDAENAKNSTLNLPLAKVFP